MIARLTTTIPRLKLLSFLFTVLFITSWCTVLTEGTALEELDTFEVPNLPTTFEYDITVIFLGINSTRVDATSLIDRLPSWYTPMDGMYWRSDHDEEFTISYNIVFADQDDVIDYRSFIEENSVEDRSPIHVQPEHPRARYTVSSEAENYLTENVADGSSATLVIIDTYTHAPSSHMPYYYNATYNELDAELGGWVSTTIPWASTYQIAGGGEDSRLLWLDLSAGPTVYHDHFDSSEGGVENVRPIWEYQSLDNPEEALEEDLVMYIAQAIECRFLPSTCFRAGYAYEEVRMEVILVDLAETDFEFEKMLDLTYIASQYERVLPDIQWTYSMSEWDWQADPSFSLRVDISMNEQEMTFDPRIVLEYIDSNYHHLTNESTKEVLVLPIFIFLLPQSWQSNPDMGGQARAVDGEFAIIYGKQGLEFVDPGYVVQETVPISNLQIQNNSYFSTGGELGRRPTNLNFSLQVQNGTVSIYFLDEYGFNQYNHSLPFENLLQTPMIDVTNTSGTIIAEDETRILGNYHLVIENNGDSNATINVAIEMTSSIFVGYTWKIMHEIGHAVGLNHPHDGYSYGNYDHPDAAAGIYLNWLWDMSYTQMNYANQAPEISLMDIDTLQREVTPRVWNDGLLRMSEIANESMSTYGVIPTTVLDHLNDAMALFNQSVEYYKDSGSLDNYKRSIRAAYDMWSALGQASAALLSEASANQLVLIGIGVGGVLILAIPIIYFVIKRRG
ncbi:MAG: M66 family metalloprotease [Candidatus Thorarchaeota archaeon]|jgi:hypothetical protein